ncbi:MAG TPA: type II secretion system protein GspC [Thioploca sp.]|nr:type II secretion system protein GspC [Thioploca sp.]
MSKLIAFIFSARWSAVINIALAAVLGYHTVQLLLLIGAASLEVRVQPNRPQPVVNQPRFSTPTLNISTLLEAQLFGRTHTVTMQTETLRANTLPETKLNFKLQGIYYSSNPQSSFAMIATANAKTASYRINDALPSGAVLHNIYAKQVILRRNGRYETLRLIGVKDIAAKNRPKTAQVNDKIRPEKLLGNYQRQLKTNPQSLMKLMRISPVKRDGRLLGYRLKPRKDATILSRFNLQSGDILTTLNGVKLDSPLKGLSVVQQLATANQINLEVLRHGRVVSLSFAVEK